MSLKAPISLQLGLQFAENLKRFFILLYHIHNLFNLTRLIFSMKSAVFLLFYSLVPGSPKGNLCTCKHAFNFVCSQINCSFRPKGP